MDMFHEGPGKVHPVDGRQAQAPRGAQPWRSNGPRRLSCAYLLARCMLCSGRVGLDINKLEFARFPGTVKKIRGGGDGGEDMPVPMPNTEAKLPRGDNSP